MATSQESPGNGGGQRRGTSARPREEIDKLKQKASQALDEAKTQGKDKLESGKDVAADTADRLANAVERAVGEFGPDTSFAGYANQLAQGMHSLAENLRTRSLNELLDEAQSLARRNPAVFLVGSVAVGLALARFLKASSERQMSETYESGGERTSGEYYTGQSSAAGYGGSTGAAGAGTSGYGGTYSSTSGGYGGGTGGASGYGDASGTSGYGGSAGSPGGSTGSSGAAGYGGTSGSGSTSGYGGDVPTGPGADRSSGGHYRGG